MHRYNMVHDADPSYRTQMLVRPDGKYVRYDDAQAEITRLTAERDAAIKALCEAAKARGQAEGKLAASEVGGVIESWKARAEKAEAEVGRLTKGSICEVAASNASIMEYMRHWETRASAAEARLEGWRAGRDAATEPLTTLAAILRKSANAYSQSQASALLERVDAIRALPEPKETSHDPH